MAEATLSDDVLQAAKQMGEKMKLEMRERRRIKRTEKDFEVGDLLMKGEDRGVVRYIGPVATARKKTTQWLGIEFEKEGRGINDGSVTTPDGEVCRYFTCKIGHGAFIRPSKAFKGWSMCECWADRYDDAQLAQNHIEQLKLAEETDYKYSFVGFNHCDKVRSNNAILNNLNCYCEPTSHIDDKEILITMFPQVTEVIIARTLIQSWETVHNLNGLPNLVELDFSFNKVKYSTFDPSRFQGMLLNLQTLIMNGVEDCWAIPVQLARAGCFPKLQELNVKYSKLTSLDVEGEPVTAEELAKLFPELKRLNFGVNRISEWFQFNRLRLLPKLEDLEVFRNPFSGMFITDGFENLEMLTASHTKISTWEEVRTLTKLKNLTNCSVGETPFSKSIGSWQRVGAILLQMCPDLIQLNQTERRSFNDINCHKVYWGYIVECLEAKHENKIPWDSLDQDMMESEYPSFKNLFQEFGVPEKRKKKKKGMATIEVTFVSHDAATCTMPSKTLKLPRTTKVSTLKLLFKKQFKVPSAEQQLLVVEDKHSLPQVMVEDQQTLKYYTQREKVEIRMVKKPA